MSDSNSDTPELKMCYRRNRCVHPDGPLLPATPEYFFRRKENKNGIRGVCKMCEGTKITTITPPGFKYCTNPDCPCDNPQPIQNFSQSKSGKGGLRERCKMCRNSDNKARYYADVEAHREKSRLWYQNNPDKVKIKRQKFQESHPDYSANYRRTHPEPGKRARSHRWRKNNPAKQKTIKIRRRARKQGLPDVFTSEEWKRCLDYFGGCCAYCGRPAGLWHVIAADHFIPLASPDCPGTISTNIVPACHAIKDGTNGCNNIKQSKPPEEWLIQKFGERKAKKILKRIRDYFDSLG